jgi:hypothetical protein
MRKTATQGRRFKREGTGRFMSRERGPEGETPSVLGTNVLNQHCLYRRNKQNQRHGDRYDLPREKGNDKAIAAQELTRGKSGAG